MGFFDLFDKSDGTKLREEVASKIKEEMLDSNSLKIIRSVSIGDISVSQKVSDQDLSVAYLFIKECFREAAKKRNEKIDDNAILLIVVYLVSIYQDIGLDDYFNALDEELDNYLKHGLDPKFDKPMEIFVTQPK